LTYWREDIFLVLLYALFDDVLLVLLCIYRLFFVNLIISFVITFIVFTQTGCSYRTKHFQEPSI